MYINHPMGWQETKILHCPKRSIITRFVGALEELYTGFRMTWKQGYVGFSPRLYLYPFPEGNKGEPIIRDFIKGKYIFPNGVQYAERVNSDICLLDEKGIVISDRYRCMKPLGGHYDVFRTDDADFLGYSGGYLVAGDGTDIIGYKNIYPCRDDCYKLDTDLALYKKQARGNRADTLIKFMRIGEEPKKKPYIKPTMKRQTIYSPRDAFLGLGK